MFKRFLNAITFRDLPIGKKFRLFFLGVLFWFLVMFLISIASNFAIDRRTDSIVNEVVPVDRLLQKITAKFQLLRSDAAEMSVLKDQALFEQHVHVSRARISDIRAFISVLLYGGEVNDVNRNTQRVIEHLSNRANNTLPGLEEYARELLPLLDSMEVKLTDLAKAGVTHGADAAGEETLFSELMVTYENLLTRASFLAVQNSTEVGALYAAHAAKIRNISVFTLYTFSAVLLVAGFLLLAFTRTLQQSITRPIQSINRQIRALSEGEADLPRKTDVTSRDELGVLSRNFNELMDEIHEMTTFKKVIEEDDSLEDIYSRLGGTFSEKFGLDEFIIYEVSGAQNKMRAVYPLVLPGGELCCNEEILNNSELCKVKKTGHRIASATYPHICRQFKEGLGKVHLCIPMIIGGKTGGVVQFLFSSDNPGGEERNKTIFRAEQYLKESLPVIEAKRLTNTLRESALRDSLTGLYNRRFLQEYTETLVAGVLRRNKIVGLIMCDLDYFKQVNDLYGHNVGDAVLKQTAQIIRKCVRTADLVIRFGGEEFLVLMLDTVEGETEKTAEKIRETVEATRVKVSDGIIKKTISLGVSEFPNDTESFWQAIKYADMALYRAKEQGRNAVVRFDEKMSSQKQL